jgi:hypothetical protein
MTIYVSLPITGYDLDERRRLAEAARLHLMAENPGAEVRIPFDIADWVDALNPQATYADYMKEDIAFIIEKADAVYFLVNPLTTRSKGVKLEYRTARIYGKRILRLAVRLSRHV